MDTPTDTLFEETTGLPPAEVTRRRLIDAYKAQLLDSPPVRCLQETEPNREKEARRLATKDVDRLLKACADSGWALSLEMGEGQ